MNKKTVPGKDGNKYVPFEKRTGDFSIVYFTRDLSADGLKKIYDRVSSVISGKTAIKLHTGEAEGPNIIPRPWVRSLVEDRLPGATIVETNTYYEGSRYTTEAHRKTLEINGWNFCPVDITDADGVTTFPVKGGKWFTEMHVGKTLPDYDSLLVLTHFKGHTMGGFGGSNKNIGIGCADGRIGKGEIHSRPGYTWDIEEEELMELDREEAVYEALEGYSSSVLSGMDRRATLPVEYGGKWVRLESEWRCHVVQSKPRGREAELVTLTVRTDNE